MGVPPACRRRPRADPAPASAWLAAAGAPCRRWSRSARSSLVDLATPAPRPADAPAGEFSAGPGLRARRRRSPPGRTRPAAPANDQVRAHLVRTLRGLGLETEVQDTVGPEAGQLSGAAGGATLARVRNVVARLPGTAPTGRVFLVAHYDSVQTGPGGNDDAAGTSTMLEVARALTAGPRPRNDVVLRAHRRRGGVPVRRGGVRRPATRWPPTAAWCSTWRRAARTGPVIMFETSPDNAALVDAFGRAAPHPVGTSFAVEIYRAAAQRHRLHRVPRPRLRRAELGLHRRRRDLPHPAGHPGRDGPGQPPAPRRQRARPGPGVRPAPT